MHGWRLAQAWRMQVGHATFVGMSDRDSPMSARRARRGPRKVTAAYLEKAALHYLERFASSEADLRRVLMAKVERSARAHATDRAEGATLVEALITRLRRSGLLDDRGYAEAKAASLHRRGLSSRAIRHRLAAHGITPELVDHALETLSDGPAEARDLAAAAAYARRRRLGPYRPAESRSTNRARDLAALGRAGFSYDVARQVIDAADVETLEALAAGGPS